MRKRRLDEVNIVYVGFLVKNENCGKFENKVLEIESDI